MSPLAGRVCVCVTTFSRAKRRDPTLGPVERQCPPPRAARRVAHNGVHRSPRHLCYSLGWSYRYLYRSNAGFLPEPSSRTPTCPRLTSQARTSICHRASIFSSSIHVLDITSFHPNLICVLMCTRQEARALRRGIAAVSPHTPSCAAFVQPLMLYQPSCNVTTTAVVIVV